MANYSPNAKLALYSDLHVICDGQHCTFY